MKMVFAPEPRTFLPLSISGFPFSVGNIKYYQSLTTSRYKTYFSVILNEEKDLGLVENTRFFAALRMTRHLYLGFCNGL